MYRHLMVPLDDSPLAVNTVQQAVKLAQALGAKMTFLHARADYGATSIGALERVILPAAFNEGMAGEARAILAKAEVVARVASVPHESVVVTSDRPHEAILGVAQARGCDLIFIASHGRRGIKGLMLGSETQKVLQHATIPVLVAAVESNLDASAVIAPLVTIADEHRSLAAVLHALEFLVRETRINGNFPSFEVLAAIMYYIKAFPETFHHPKEDAYLFPKLRLRAPEFDGTLAELERQHVEGSRLVKALEDSIARYEADPATGFADFAAAVERFTAMQMQHMILETKVIIPAARERLTAEDWKEIGEAFAGNSDPRFNADTDEEFRQLLARILNLVPERVVGGAGDR